MAYLHEDGEEFTKNSHNVCCLFDGRGVLYSK